YNFLLLMYEHLFIFRKPSSEEEAEKYRDSSRWW
ncbi:MAG: DNA methylase, partial [Thermoplasmata archaeon]